MKKARIILKASLTPEQSAKVVSICDELEKEIRVEAMNLSDNVKAGHWYSVAMELYAMTYGKSYLIMLAMDKHIRTVDKAIISSFMEDMDLENNLKKDSFSS